MTWRRQIQRLIEGKSAPIIRGMSILAAGSGGAKLISVLALPLLTRIFPPEEFGALSVIAAVTLVISPFFSLGYSAALPLARGDRAGRGLFALTLLTIGTLVSVGLVLGGVAEALFPALQNVGTVAQWWVLILLCAACLETIDAFALWSTRTRNFRTVSLNQIQQAITSEATKLALGLLGLVSTGLLWGYLSGLLFGALGLILRFKRDVSALASEINLRRLWIVARRYRHFPTYRLSSHALVLIALQLPVVLISSFYGAASAGKLGLALMAMSLPANLIGENMARAYYSEVARIPTDQRNEIRSLTRSVILRLGIISLPAAILLALLGAPLFGLVFGPEWAESGMMASALSIYLVFQFSQKPLPYFLYICNLHRLLLAINIQRLAITGLSLWIPWTLGFSVIHTLVVYAIVLSVHQLLAIFIALRLSRQKIQEPISP